MFIPATSFDNWDTKRQGGGNLQMVTMKYTQKICLSYFWSVNSLFNHLSCCYKPDFQLKHSQFCMFSSPFHYLSSVGFTYGG